MATRTIEGYLTTTNAGTILTPGQLLTATITSYEASTSGTITAVSVSFSRNIVLYSTSSLKLYLNGSYHGTTATYSNNTALFDFVEYDENLLSIEPTSVYFVVESGAVYYNSSEPTFTITITYNESTTTTPTLNNPGIPYVSYTPGNNYYQVSWDAATVSNGDTNITYSLLEINNSIFVARNLSTPSFTSYEVPIAGTEYRFRVFAYYGDQITQNENSNNYIFPELIKQSTVGYYTNGAWQECVVYYYDGSEWVECIPYYYDSGWQEINTKI